MAQAVPTVTKEETLSAPLETIANISEEVMDKMKDVTSDVGDRVGNFAKSATKTLNSAKKEVTGLIKRNPLEAIAIGFGVGLLRAFLVRRSR